MSEEPTAGVPYASGPISESPSETGVAFAPDAAALAQDDEDDPDEDLRRRADAEASGEPQPRTPQHERDRAADEELSRTLEPNGPGS
jgi:hypothetical protein